MELNQHDVLADLQRRAADQRQYLEQTLAPLDETLLNQKPDEKSWSVLECLEHLNIIGETYLSNFQQAAQNGTDRVGETYHPGWLGNRLARWMLPREDGQIPMKMKALGYMNPRGSQLGKAQVLDRQQTQLRTFQETLDALSHVDLGRTKVSSSLGSWHKMKLGDALRFYLNHQSRHYQQIVRTLSQVSSIV